jgi:branched-chain amino acid transport system substrate-binding protein
VRLRQLIALVAAWAVVASACSDADAPRLVATATPPPPVDIVIPPDEPIEIGVSIALTGDQGELGSDLAAAVETAVVLYGGAVKGHTVELLVRDDGCSDPLRAVSVAEEFTARAALAGVIGPMCTNGALAANLRYERAGIVHISPSATRVDLSSLGDRFFFRTVWRDDAQAAVQATYARQGMQATTAFLISDREPYGNALASEFRTKFEAAGGRVVEQLSVARGTVDMDPIAGRIADADPDVVVYEGTNPEGALLIVALRDAGFEGGFIGPDGLLNARDFLLPAGDAARGAVVTGGATPSLEYAGAFESIHARPLSTSFVLQAHDAATALLKALETVAKEDPDGSLRIDREELAAAIREQRFAGLTGSITFDEHGDRRGESAAELGVSVYRVDAGVFVAIE